MATECPNCRSPVQPFFVHCKQCGTRLTEEPAEEESLDNENEHSMTAHIDPTTEAEAHELAQSEPWLFSSDEGWVPTPRAPGEAPARPIAEIHWGGFWRRCGAFIIDIVAVGVLAVLMTSMSYVGYKVGLAAHDRRPDLDNTAAFVVALSFATALLATGYFVLLHSMSGKTIGKSIFNLRVVGADQEGISYARAFLRWIATVFTAPLVIGVLWVVWSAEKRSWHDIIAGTWVIRN